MGCEGSKAGQSKPHSDYALKSSSSRSSTLEVVPRIHERVKSSSRAFCPIKGINNKKLGGLTLMHFPGAKHIKALSESGCDIVVTLQKDAEGAQNVGKLCEKVGIKWIQIDFWKLFHKKQHDELYDEVQKVATHLRKGANIMIHCAAGIHRTGMFSYSVLRSLGYTSKAAVASLESLRTITFKRVGYERIVSIEQFFEDHFPFTDEVPEGSLPHNQPQKDDS
eukprot:TRINITY_DN12857_c0_g1_i1.p1 TRINITY_DN12857_c0_g1~~TRINITY_DN12857_c0_g1_i1.p1  ORF type:complete len:247 (+),score=36.63 TRINITY_DN12857_c0_g1_i1:76-741(+)